MSILDIINEVNEVQKANIAIIAIGFEELALEQERLWKSNTDNIVNEKEKELDGSISVHVGKRLINPNVNPIQYAYIDNDAGEEVVRIVQKGLNDLPESFNANERRRNLISVYDRDKKDKVTEYPKDFLYNIEESNLPEFIRKFLQNRKIASVQKLIKKLKKEHIRRRTEYYARRMGVGYEEDVATQNKFLITDIEKYTHKKYMKLAHSMSDKDGVDMTREEAMKNKVDLVMNEFYETEEGRSARKRKKK